MNGGYVFKAMDDHRNFLTFCFVRETDMVKARASVEKKFNGGILELIDTINSDQIHIWVKSFAERNVILSKGSCVNMATYRFA